MSTNGTEQNRRAGESRPDQAQAPSASVDALAPTAFARLLLVLWCSWVVVCIAEFVLDPRMRSGSGSAFWGASIGSFLVPALGCYLVWRLYRRPTGGVALAFALVCICLLWKFVVGPAYWIMQASERGHTLGQSIAAWWSFSASTRIRAEGALVPIVLLPISLFYWPIYHPLARLRIDNRNDGNAVC